MTIGGVTMKALITGFTGMVGSHLADFLIENTDWNIIGFSRWIESFENVSHLIPRINSEDRISVIYGDMNDFSSIESALRKNRPDFIFHLAAQSYPQTSFTAPIETMQTNVIGTLNLLEAAKNIVDYDPIIHVCSSSEVFGKVDQSKLPIDEECTFHPASPYAISKVGTDLLGRHYSEAYGLNTQTTRMFTHTGPRRADVFAESTFAKQIAMIEFGLIPPVINTGNLDSLRTWADVRDAVRAYHLLVTCNPVPGAYYNIGGPFSCSVRDMLDTLISLSNFKGEISIQTDPRRLRPIDADLQVPDTSKFQDHTGWKPQIDFKTTMTDLLEYWRKKVENSPNQLTR